jgi:phosphoribosylformylglycinamidine synthase subunit PurQ / glutaminase
MSTAVLAPPSRSAAPDSLALPRAFRVGVIVFPGSNCDTDAGNAWDELGLGETVYLWHADTDLKGVDIVIVPGGFSYGDALRAGAIARFAPIMNEVARFASEGGLVIGICNGFQILCEAGLLPGALVRNEGMRFVCRHVHLRVENVETPFTALYKPGEILTIPVAHGEGRYLCEDETYQQLVAENRIMFRYVNEDGKTSPDANPNGSRDDIAGILGGPANNILGMMPHPERAVSQRLGSADGQRMFYAIHAALAQKLPTPSS